MGGVRSCAVAGIAAAVLVGCQSSSETTSTGLRYHASAPVIRPYSPSPDTTAPGYIPPPALVPSGSEWHQAAAGWLGTPYLDGGHDRRGVDCSGYTDCLYREVVGRGIPRTAYGQWLEGKAISVENIRPGDLVFFQTTGAGVSHVGLSLGGTDFTHASSSKGVMISSLNDPYWHDRFMGARRMSP